MTNGILALAATFLLLPKTGLARVNPAQSVEDLDRRVEKSLPGNEDLSVLSNTDGLKEFHLGLGPYIPELNQAGLINEEDTIFRQAESQTGTGSSSPSDSKDATER